MTAVLIKDLSFRYAQTPPNQPAALNAISLVIPEKSIFGLLGPNGSGKSTLFKILSTLIRPDEGSVQVFGLDLISHSHNIRQNLGVVFQHPSLDKILTVEENLIHQGELLGLQGQVLKEKIHFILTQLRLSDRKKDFVKTLSGGLQRRVEIGKCLLTNPRLLLLDEPSTGLDPLSRKEMWDIIENCKKNGTTVILTTHLLEEADRCDELAIFNKGQIVGQGTPAELKKRVGGDVITIQSNQCDTLAQSLRKQYSEKISLSRDDIRIEIKDGHKLIPEIIESYPGQIQSIKLGKPTLEDVFFKETGASLESMREIK